MAGFPNKLARALAIYLRDGQFYNVTGLISDRFASGLSQDLGDRLANSLTDGLQKEVASMLGHHLSDRLVTGLPRALANHLSLELTSTKEMTIGLKALQKELAIGMKEPTAAEFVAYFLDGLPKGLEDYFSQFGSQALWPVILYNLTLW